MEIYLYANMSRVREAPDAVIAFESREAVNAYLNAAYNWVALCTMDRHGGKLPEGAETRDEFRTRVWHACVTRSELWSTKHVAQDLKLALDAREERKHSRLNISVAGPDDNLEF